MWRNLQPKSTNVIAQNSHLYGLSPVWIRMWRFTLSRLLKAWSHTVHTYGRSPVCERSCSCKQETKRKVRGHILQLYGRSSVCVRRCVTKVARRRYVRPHTSHLCGFSPVCKSRWRAMTLRCGVVKGHKAQAYLCCLCKAVPRRPLYECSSPLLPHSANRSEEASSISGSLSPVLVSTNRSEEMPLSVNCTSGTWQAGAET